MTLAQLDINQKPDIVKRAKVCRTGRWPSECEGTLHQEIWK